MIKATNVQVLQLLEASKKLEDVELDNERGDIAAKLHAEATVKQIAYQYRVRSLQKERAKLLNDHAQKDAKGQIKYGESPNGDPAARPVLFRNQTAANAAFEAWQKKIEELDAQVVEFNVAPVRDDFFAKPAEILVKHAVRIGFIPFMAAAQAALKNGDGKPKKRNR